MYPTSNELLSVSPSVPQGLGSHGRSREISPRRVKSRELFSEVEYCKEVEPLFRPPLPLSGIENPDEQTPCLLPQSPRISLRPFATSPKATHPAKEISQPCTNVQFRSGTRAESILSTSYSLLVSTFFPSPLSGWVVLPRWFLMVLKPLTL